MAAFHADLLDTAQLLIKRAPRQSGRIPGARIRRSISTCYYALFHFLLDDASRRLVRNESRHLARRRVVTRSFTHAGVKSTFNKIRGAAVDKSLVDFMRPPGGGAGAAPAPDFARFMAAIFFEAQAQRHNADYDLNVSLSETDARELQKKCREAIERWQKAMKADERDFKDALAVVMLLKGQLRRDD